VPKLCESHRGRFLRNHYRLARALFEVAAAGRSTRNGAGKAAGWQALISASRRLIGIWERTGRLAGLPTHPVHWGTEASISVSAHGFSSRPATPALR